MVWIHDQISVAIIYLFQIYPSVYSQTSDVDTRFACNWLFNQSQSTRNLRG